YDGRCRAGDRYRPDVPPVVRFKNPLEGEVVVDDLVKGRIVFANSELDDLVIARSDGTPTYNFTVVVDDADMRITHVIRGDDHVNNTPRQINICRALGETPPAYAHLPMIHGPDGTKLSKRHGAVNVLEYRDMGFLPQAMLNYIARLGWSYGDQEIFTIDELIRYFDLDGVSGSSASFDPMKLLWVNQQHMMRAPVEQIAPLLEAQLRRQGLDPRNGPPLDLTIEALRERSQTIVEMAERAHCYYEEFEAFDEKAARTHLTEGGARRAPRAERGARRSERVVRGRDRGGSEGCGRAAGVEAWQGRPAAAGGVDGTGGVARYWRDTRARRARQGREADRAGYRIYRAAERVGGRGPQARRPAVERYCMVFETSFEYSLSAPSAVAAVVAK